MNKVVEFLKKNVVEIGFIAVSLLLMFLPFTPYPLKTFGFGLFFTSLGTPLIKHIINSQRKK